jgi:hypothetical protein
MFILSKQELTSEREGSSSTQMTPKLENKAFSGKSTQYIHYK